MTKKRAGILGPSISLWECGVAVGGIGCSALLASWSWPVLIFGGFIVFGAFVESVFIAAKGGLNNDVHAEL